ncbi:gluconate dehydratase [Halarchaeum acidiphilum MH1-52-1]|uniref:Gluconate dehydratase n=1 Tax=Halarchaeum acidiphilum MH1-52-1 TaxID=1261545 RepID=U3AG43_9EURY|nr:gluconate dehydratase [Halarchaeum acidiphilum]GAD53763.1 gluconate dehydratase [Halarchaeum acidiphilum MH1-52-1]
MRDYSLQTTRPSARDVEITDISTTVVKGNFEWNLITVETDAGITGIEEAYRGGGFPNSSNTRSGSSSGSTRSTSNGSRATYFKI